MSAEVLGFAAALAFFAALAFLFALCRAAARHHQPPAELHQSPTPARATKSCTVPFCDDPVQIHLHVGHDWWTFCLAHGLPYLTGDLHREAS